MMELIGPDQRRFRFQEGASYSIIAETIAANYPGEDWITEDAVVAAFAKVQASTPRPPAVLTPPAPSQPPRLPRRETRPQDDPSAPKNAPMGRPPVVQIAVLAGIVALVGLWVAWDRMGPPDGGKGLSGRENGYQSTPQPDLRRTIVDTQAREAADPASPVVRDLRKGVELAVQGELTVDSLTWAQVRLEDATNRTGWVVKSHLTGTIAGTDPQAPGAVKVEPDPDLNAAAPQASAPPAPKVEPAPERISETYYVDAEQLNVRPGASTSGSILGKFRYGERVRADLRTRLPDSIWVRASNDRGLQGWVNLRYLSNVPVASNRPFQADEAAQAADAAAAAATAVEAAMDAAAADFRAMVIRLPAVSLNGVYVQVATAQDATEFQSLNEKIERANRCVGFRARMYSTDKGWISARYGPYSTQAQASQILAEVRPCISDAFAKRLP